MRVIALTILTIIAVTITRAQDENVDKYITAMIASDTILEGNSFEFKVVIRNLKGDFTPPSFADFDIVGGPNMSTNMQYTNGSMFRESTYTYYLKARKVGEYYIEESYLEVDGGSMETPAIQVYVLDNPEEIQKNYRITDGGNSDLVFPFDNGMSENPASNAKKKKRKLKKI